MERLGPVRDPFSTEKGLSSKKIDERYISTSGLSVNSRLSAISGRSISRSHVRHMLGNQRDNNTLYSNLVTSKLGGSRMELGAPQEGGYSSSRRGSNASQLGMPMMSQNRRGSNASQLAPHGLAAPGGPRMGRRPSAMINDGYVPPHPGTGLHRRTSAFGAAAFHVGKVVPDDGNVSVNLLVRSGDDDDEELDTSWRALPEWWTDIVPNRITASVSLVILTSLTIYVFADSIMTTARG
jgi:hypothetical protein